MNFGAFAGGMAGGLSTGLQLKNMMNRTKIDAGKEAREAEEHGWKKADREGLKRSFERFNSEVLPMSFRGDGSGAPMTAAPMPESVALKPIGERPSFGSMGGLGAGVFKGFAAGGLVSEDEFTRSMGPSSTPLPPVQAQLQQPAQPMQQAPAQQMDPKETTMRAMWDGDLLNDPDKLTAMAKIFQEEGVGREMIPWLQKAYEAKKTNKVNGAMKLLQGDVDGAVSDLAKGGVKLADRPVKVSDDPNDHRWKINIEGSGEQTMDVNHLVATTMDPDKYLESHYKRKDADREFGLKENEDKRKESKNTADIGLVNSQSEYYKGAKTNEAMARAERYGRMGSGSGTDRPEKIDAALKRRDSTVDDLSKVKGEDGKWEVDPKLRLQYNTAADRYQTFLENHLGGELSAKEHHMLTDALKTFPVGDLPAQKEWGRLLLRRFGGNVRNQAAPQDQALQQPAPQELPPGLSDAAAQAAPQPAAAPQVAPAPRSGLAAMKEQQALRERMNGIQIALRNPNLTVEQKQALAIQAQQVAAQRDAFDKGR